MRNKDIDGTHPHRHPNHTNKLFPAPYSEMKWVLPLRSKAVRHPALYHTYGQSNAQRRVQYIVRSTGNTAGSSSTLSWEETKREDRTYGGLSLAMALPKETHTHTTPEAMLQTQP